jgi:hypothetical protein
VFIQAAKLLRKYYANMTPEQRIAFRDAQLTWMEEEAAKPVSFNG